MYNETKTHEITVDTVILTIKNNALQALLIRRDREKLKAVFIQKTSKPVIMTMLLPALFPL